MKTFITGVIMALIAIYGFTTVQANNFTLNGKDLYAVDQTNPQDVFLITDTLYTDKEMKEHFDTAKRIGYKDGQEALSTALSDINSLEAKILRLETKSVDAYECILQLK